MHLSNITIVGETGIKNIRVSGSLIDSISIEHFGEKESINFENAIVFPGLINSHDHLEFSCFSLLGNYKYKNYVEWGGDIHRINAATIKQVLKIPEHLRIQWGIYKNLLNGITTVVHHGPPLQISDEIIRVFQNCYALHSVRLQKHWRRRLNNPFDNKWPYVIHVGEGTDSVSSKEIDTLLKWNLFKKTLIGVHGVSMNQRQAQKFKALVWCPYSNEFLLGACAPMNELKTKTNIVFGTDSCVSGSWNLWDHLGLARKTKCLTDQELFDALTINPAKAWDLNEQGKLKEGFVADIVIAKNKSGRDSMVSFFELQPQDILLVMHKGEIVLFDESLKDQLPFEIKSESFSSIQLKGTTKFLKGNLNKLIEDIRKYYPDCNFPLDN